KSKRAWRLQTKEYVCPKLVCNARRKCVNQAATVRLAAAISSHNLENQDGAYHEEIAVKCVPITEQLRPQSAKRKEMSFENWRRTPLADQQSAAPTPRHQEH